MRTIHDSKVSLFASAAVLCLTVACANQRKANTHTPQDSQASHDTPVSDASIDEVALDTIDGDLTSPDAASEPEYTSVEVFIDPTILAACNIEPPKVYFETDSARVRDVGDVKLDYVADCLNRNPLDGELIEVIGRADPRGPEEYNRELGLDRANAVASRLSDYGVTPRRIDTYSVGEKDADADPDLWPANRRVVVRLDK